MLHSMMLRMELIQERGKSVSLFNELILCVTLKNNAVQELIISNSEFMQSLDVQGWMLNVHESRLDKIDSEIKKVDSSISEELLSLAKK